MRVIIKEAEINVALKAYMVTCGLDLNDQTVEIDLQATRGPEGYTATIDISPAGSVAQEAEELPVANSKPAATLINEPAANAAPVRRGPGRPPKNPVAAAPDPEPVQDIEEEEVPAAAPESEEIEEEAAPAPTTRPSLFGGLNRPNNA
jgi:hypothetical protein